MKLQRLCMTIFLPGILLMQFNAVDAAKVEGFVFDEKHDPLPYCNIYVKGTTGGVASNDEGYFSLTLPAGDHVLVFQYIGYKKKELPLQVLSDDITVDIVMELDITELQEVVIRSDDEDPAYEIIRNAIEVREKHLTETPAYSCDVYMKGMQKLLEAPDRILGIELNTVLDVDSNNTGIVYLSESVSQFYFAYPDKTKEVMVASKVSGDDNQFSWNDARSMQMNFYENLITMEGFSQRGFVSPVADHALFFYDYKLLGSFMEDGFFIYKIRVIPKRESDPVFSGIIYIHDTDFSIYSSELTVSKSQGLEFIDTFTVSQEYIKMPDDTWVLLSNKFDFNYGIFGIKGVGYFNAFYKNYNLSPGFDDKFFTPEISIITEGSNKKDSLYWESTRPVPLTGEEQEDYIEKDSLRLLKETSGYKDSIDRIFNRFSPGNLISGYQYRNSNKHIFIQTTSLPALIQYNTVEGWVVKPAIGFNKTFENKKKLFVNPEARYSITNNRLSATLLSTFTYDPIKSAAFMLQGGAEPVAYNPNAVLPFVNSLYTLFLEKNFLKIYDQQFVSASHTQELFNGFTVRSGITYASRKQLYNISDITPLVDYETRSYTDNNFPFASADSVLSMPDIFQINLTLRYTPKQLYMITPDEKYILESNYPVFTINYKKAVPDIFNSSINYDYADIAVRDIIRLRLQGNLEYECKTGLFLQHDNVSFADIRHFEGNETWISNLQGYGYFLLPYYIASTTDPFFEAHIQWHTEGFLFNKLPLFKQLKLQPVFTFNYLTAGEMNNYIELAAGIEHLFRFARIDVAYTPYRFGSEYQYAEKFKCLIGIGF